MTFVDEGGTHVHIVRNEGDVQAIAYAFRLVPSGQPGRIDAPDPGNCAFLTNQLPSLCDLAKAGIIPRGGWYASLDYGTKVRAA